MSVTWQRIPAVELRLAADGAPPRQPTAVRICADSVSLHVRFDCVDDEVRARHTRRDDPLYEEETVEVFLATGGATPTSYLEFEVNPLGALFDARVENPDGKRATLRADPSWDCPDLRWGAEHRLAEGRWSAWLSIPWGGLAPDGKRPEVLRANFFRIDRPSKSAAEFSCWSPTYTDPADFHVPKRLGRLDIGG